MALIDSLKYLTTIDSSGWKKGIDSGLKEFEAFDKHINDRLQKLEIPAPKINEAGLGDGGKEITSIAGEITASFSQLAPAIQTAMRDATKPLQGFAATFGKQFEEVGGPIKALAIRIDSAMRFPTFLERAESFRTGLLKLTLNTVKTTSDTIDKGFRPKVKASDMALPFLEGTEQIKKAVAPIPGLVGYATEAAEHTDSKAAFKPFMDTLEEVKSATIDKMKAAADAIENATGKGSRIGRRERDKKAADLDAKLKAAPPKDNTTPAGKGAAPHIPTPFWPPAFTKAIAASGSASDALAKKLGLDIPNGIAATVKVVDALANHVRLIGVAASGAVGAFVGFQKAASVMSSLGSVAKKTLETTSKLKIPMMSGVGGTKALGQVSGAAKNAGNSFRSMGQQLMMALGIFGLIYKAVDFLKEGVVNAAGLNETLSKTDAVLGSASGAVKGFADELAGKFGLVKKETLDVAAGFGGLFKGLGNKSGPALAKVTNDFTKLSADLSSFSNISMKEAGQALRTALAGNESDTLKGLGVVTDEATVKAYAYSHGIAKVGAELNAEQKIMARTGVITEGLKDVQGDLDRTASSTANQFRKFTGNVTNLGATIGSALMPAVDGLLAIFNKLVEWASKAFIGTGDSFNELVAKVTYGADFIQAALDNPKAAFEVMRLVAFQALINIGEYFDTLGPNISSVATYIQENWMLLLGDAFEWTLNAIKNVGDNFAAIGKAIGEFLADPTKGFHVDWTSLSEGFKATAGKFPEFIKPALTDMSKEIAAAAQPIINAVQAKADKAKADAESAAKAAAARAAKADPDGAEKTGESDLQKFAKSLTKDTQTPIEAFREKVAKIRDALKANLIDAKTGERGLADAKKDLEGSGPKLSGALQAGSTDARSAILNAMNTQRKSPGEQAAMNTANNTRATNGLLTKIEQELIRSRPTAQAL